MTKGVGHKSALGDWGCGGIPVLPIGVVVLCFSSSCQSLRELELALWTAFASAALLYLLHAKSNAKFAMLANFGKCTGGFQQSKSVKRVKQMLETDERVFPKNAEDLKTQSEQFSKKVEESKSVKRVKQILETDERVFPKNAEDLKTQSEQFSKKVEELLEPLKNSDPIVEQITAYVAKTLKGTFSEVEVAGSSCIYFHHTKMASDSTSCLHVRINVSIEEDQLFRVFGLEQHGKVDTKESQRTIINCLTMLLAKPEVGFTLGRKLFHKSLPCAILIAPPSFQTRKEAISIQLFLNSASEVQRTALIEKCQEIESRAKGLILLVERWAKHHLLIAEAKGELTSFTWTLLAVYFLQVGGPGEPLLPPMQGFKLTTGSVKFSASGEINGWKAPAEGPAAIMSVGQLFKTFLNFWTTRFNWRNDVISIRLGVGSAPTNIPQHVNIKAGASSAVGPWVEDPFDPTQYLTTNVTALQMHRLQEAFQTSVGELQNGCSLSQLLAL